MVYIASCYLALVVAFDILGRREGEREWQMCAISNEANQPDC